MNKVSKELQKNWEENFEKLKKYKQRFKNCNVPIEWEEDKKLAAWVDAQRKGKHKLPDDFVKKLEKLGFDFNYKESSWEVKYRELLNFQKKFGHIQVPSTDPAHRSLYLWLDRQKRNQTFLSEQQYESLDNIGIIWNYQKTLDAKWEEKYDELVNYKKEFGNCEVPSHWKGNPKLGAWVSKQRDNFKKGKLSEERVKKLKKLGFKWEIERSTLEYDKKWEEHFQQLVDFKKKFGHVRVPYQWKENPSLSRWVQGQRERYYNQKAILTKDKIKRLLDLGFIFYPIEEQWMEMYENLKAYKKKYGHIHVSTLDPESKRLSKWLSYFKTRKDSLPPEKVKLLNKLGVEWEIKPRTFYTWKERYKQLVTFKKKFGHTHVPSTYDKSLAKWVRDIRAERSPVSKERKKLLKEIGFDWKGVRKSWEEMFEVLLKFKKKYGHTQVSRSWKDKSLSIWVANTRRKKETLSKDKVKKLESIGFQWAQKKK